MEDHNNTLKQAKRRKERNNILELLNRPWSLNGWILNDASDDQKRDKEIVMAAVNQYGLALKFISEDIQRDREIVMAAVKKGGLALKFAS